MSREERKNLIESNMFVVVSSSPPKPQSPSFSAFMRILPNPFVFLLGKEKWSAVSIRLYVMLIQVGEVGELSEIFQWRGEVPKGLPGWNDEDKEHLGEELSDVLLYLVRLSDICGVDLAKAALRKVELNAIKYPAKQCKGSSRKYNHMINRNNSSESS